MAKSYDYLFKIDLMGESDSGRAKVLKKFSENAFSGKSNSSTYLGEFKITPIYFNYRLCCDFCHGIIE